MTLSKMKRRALILFSFLAVLLGALIFRIGYWQIVRGEEMRDRVTNQQTNEAEITANRGTIYDRNYKVLAESATVNTLVCNPQQIKKDGGQEIVATKLSEILGIDRDVIYEKITKDNQFQYIKKRITIEETEEIKKLKDSSVDKEMAKLFSGVYFEEDSKRYYRYNIAAHVIGFTGYDNNGQGGIELTFDDYLMGRKGSVLSARTGLGLSSEYQYEEAFGAQKGDDVVLTIDETIQAILEKYLEQACVENQLKEGACGIIMNPKTGEILAMATKPDFDLNDHNDITRFTKYAIGIDELFELEEPEEVEEGEEPEADDPDKPLKFTDEAVGQIRQKMWRNKAISDTYEPGSTFKILTAAMALEEGVVSLDTTFNCTGSKKVADRIIRCHKAGGHGEENFVRGVINSCNVVFMDVGLSLGSDKFQEYFKAFGLTDRTGIELAGESGSVYYHGKMSETDIATSSFGQGISVTPIQMITAISAVINGGNLMKPQIVKEIRNSGGIVKSFYPEVVNRVISEDTSATMRNILESVVNDPKGTGKNAYIKGFRIGGKTGTSEKGRNNNKRIASFVGFAPADDPQLICLVMFDEPQVANKYGGTIAAPVVGAILEESLEYLGVDRQYTEEEAQAVSVTVPDLRSLTVTEAKGSIDAKKLTIKVVGTGDIVVDQLPKPGVSIGANSTIIVYTEERDENKKIIVPDVTGLSVSQAKKRITDAGLNFEIAGAGLTNEDGAYAFKQSIEPGTEVEPATIVSVEFRHASSD